MKVQEKITKLKLLEMEYQLKEIKESDINHIHRGLSDPDVTRYYDVHFPTLEATREQMQWYASLKEEGTGIWWGIYDRNDKFCGAGGFNGHEKKHKKAEIGLWLLKEYWGRGILKIVMPVLFDRGFKELGLNRIEGFVDSENTKCKVALEKINFTHEGCLRESEIKNGRKISIDIYSILKSEWESILK